MGTTAHQPITPILGTGGAPGTSGQGGRPIGALCNIMKTGDGEFVITGDSDVLRDYFDSSPELWLRCLALTKEDKDG